MILLVFRVFSKNHIDAVINDSETERPWRLIGFCGYPDTRDTDKGWDLICHFHGSCNLPWIICGDFNEMSYSHEKIGGVPRDDRQMEGFRRVLTNCGLIDGDYSGSCLTWEWGKLYVMNIRERLDRK